MSQSPEVVHYASPAESDRRKQLAQLVRTNPIPDTELLDNLGVFLNGKTLARLKFMDFIYEQIVEVPGVVMEFGTRWGQNLSHWAALRGIYEPFNRHRKLIGFDTFAGFAGVSAEDGKSKMMTPGNYAVTPGYEQFLQQVLEFQEAEAPLAHIRKFELVKGDATVTLPRYLEQHPETIVALAYFDFDLYEPTKRCLELIRPRLVKGSLVGFDELNDPDAPGETLAVMETLGLNNVRLRRLRHTSRTAYFVVE
ncbi:MAG: crotonobetainyl-CoA--carnitine CoA-transferase [Verrucomicrobia bacterium]|nr:crotonobetainyl-CoA--carnitine CoA-transferase [Verrucomicrobiota bacterium]